MNRQLSKVAEEDEAEAEEEDGEDEREEEEEAAIGGGGNTDAEVGILFPNRNQLITQKTGDPKKGNEAASL